MAMEVETTIPSSPYEGERDNEIPKPKERCGSSMSDWSDFGLRWLFDPHRFDHLPIEEQVKRYKQRDLRKVKVYKIASDFWGAPISRKRVIVAPPMVHPEREADSATKYHSPVTTSELKPQIRKDTGKSAETLAEEEEQARMEKHSKWVKKRKDFRQSLDSMGLSESWLSNKPCRTALENRVMHRMAEERTPRPPEAQMVDEKPVEAVLPDQSPYVKRPSPIAVGIIENFLHENRMRLIDLFASVDKNKNWRISRDEFRTAVHKAQIPISDVLLEDLILTLDTDLTDELDYRELATGMGLWRAEKRGGQWKNKKSGRFSAPTKHTRSSVRESPDTLFTHSNPTPPGKAVANRNTSPTTHRADSANGRIKSALSTVSSSSSQYLEPPPSDLREEQLILSPEAMLDLRKRDREVLARIKKKKMKDGKRKKEKSNLSKVNNIIRTGEKVVDEHSMPSTLGGDTGELVDKFRQLKLKEYHQVVKLCKENNMTLTEELLSKVLLFPPDKPKAQLEQSLRQPATPLWSSHLADPPKPPKISLQEKHKDSLKVTKSGKLLIDSRHTYPTRSNLTGATRITLSTGKAVIRPQVDCWMTFEQYDKFTGHLGVRYTQLHGRVDQNAFWPGHLLDKLRLCMPNAEPHRSSIFRIVRPSKITSSSYNDYQRTTSANKAG